MLHNMDFGLTFSWPKHHSFDHAVDIIRRKGPSDNYETGIGESLHPQIKADYERSSHQPDTVDQQVLHLPLADTSQYLSYFA